MSGLRRIPLLVLPFLISFALAAGRPSPAAAAPPPAAETAGAIAKLPPRQRDFLELVALLISDKERAVFLALPHDYQRDAFIRRFWEVRDPEPRTPRNEFRDAWEARARLARERYGNLTEDRAKMILWNGPPGRIAQALCSDVLLPLEMWSYDGTDRLKGTFTLVFVSPQGSMRGPYRLWYPAEGLSAVLTAQARVHSDAEVEELLDHCPQGNDAAGLLGLAVDWAYVQAHAKLAPHPGEEWLTTFLSRSTDLPQDAASFPATVEVSFPGTAGSRTVMQGIVAVPRDQAQPETLEKTAAYAFLVDGEILHQGELFETFRYRFNVPVPDAQTASLPLVFQRYLRPGSYTLVLKVEDLGGKRFFREQRDLEIPFLSAPPPAAATGIATTPAASSPAAPGAAAAAPALAEANDRPFGSDEQSIRLLPPPPGLVTGHLRLEAMTAGRGIARVRFQLNGKPVLTKTLPPYSVELNLGDSPKVHTVDAIALGAAGEKLAADQILLNSGPHRFSVRLTEPLRGKRYQASLRAEAQVNVPEGEKLDRVEMYLNEARVATLYQPPYVQPILIPPGHNLEYVRAVAYLADGNSTEDLVLVNAPDYVEEMNVDFVELYTSVVDGKGHPVDGLAQKDFTVLEDGKAQEVRRFDLVRDRPIYAAILLDTSASMGENDNQKLNEAVHGALRFFKQVIKPKDRAAVFTFNKTMTQAVRFTNQIDALSGGLTGLTAEGNTALYDSIIGSLYYFGGLKGKRALLLLTDGEDYGSHYRFEQALDYARRSGVAMYVVGINLPDKAVDVRSKLYRLAEETGGRSFFIHAASELARVFDLVDVELRSQYLLAYQSPQQAKDGAKYRAVEVKLARPGLEAKTIRGYFP